MEHQQATADVQACLPQLAQPHPWTAGECAALHAIFGAAGDDAAASLFKHNLPPGAALFVEEQRLLASQLASSTGE